jgi:hypothetical protein
MYFLGLLLFGTLLLKHQPSQYYTHLNRPKAVLHENPTDLSTAANAFM